METPQIIVIVAFFALVIGVAAWPFWSTRVKKPRGGMLGFRPRTPGSKTRPMGRKRR